MIATTLSKTTRVAGATFFATGLLLSAAAQAQINTPAASPISTITQRVGLTDVSITYSRPSAKGRVVFGSLRPYDVRWRTGANATTKIKFSDDVTVEGQKVAAGEYGIYSVPGKNSWTIVLSKDTKRGADVDGFKDEDNVAKFTVKPYRVTEKHETFTINFADLTPATANVTLEWENTGVKFGIKTDVDTKVMAQINDKVLNNASASAGDLAAAAVYYIDNNKDNKQALAWLKKANATDPKFWNLHTQAKLELKMKDKKAAIASAEQSKKLAANAKNDEYVKMNDALIAEAKK
ncbi:DUF2911 domain-containing protein [Hymenobacter aerilatus]|uniref:DUF2911 domain-containing protein n=1 Tax=Hymenobacter aerilatus TaxID=2932251 RepID=A0A8T9SX80_9BACT|nr:DUF2911 domain-containing protein [Hymenobacter aerilatus]UOR05991.1 DUF2911 domain-containing protein [Hymenobacter aerilatus]